MKSISFVGSDVFNDEPSPVRSAVGRRKSIIKDPGRKSIGSNRKTVSFGSLPTELTVRSAKDCLKHMYSGGQLVKARDLIFSLIMINLKFSFFIISHTGAVSKSSIPSVLLVR